MKIIFKNISDTTIDVCLGGLVLCRLVTENEKTKVFSLIVNEVVAEIVSSNTKKLNEFVHAHIDDSLASVEWSDEETVIKQCPELHNLLKAELDIFRKHLDRHKWFQQIGDEKLAAMDFAKKYGWIMKELYCMHACRKKNKCAHAVHLRQGAIEENPIGIDK
jgi:hypothetical protein